MNTPAPPADPAHLTAENPAHGAATDRSTGLIKGLTWSVLRLHRSALLIGAAFLTVSVVGLLWLRSAGPQFARDSGYCIPDDGPPCPDGIPVGPPTETIDYLGNLSLAATVIAWLPIAVAAYAGGVLIGRELERGTAALSWTQSVSPARWLAAKLLLPALLITAGTALLSLMYRLARRAFVGVESDSWHYVDVFRALGPVNLAYALCGLAAGAVAGLLARRALPAAGFALLAVGLLNLLADRYREHLWPLVERTTTGRFELANSVWQLENGVLDTAGNRLESSACWDAYGPDLAACQTREGLSGSYAVYHPSSHFWPLQLVESGIVLAVTAALTFAAFRVLRHRYA